MDPFKNEKDKIEMIKKLSTVGDPRDEEWKEMVQKTSALGDPRMESERQLQELLDGVMRSKRNVEMEHKEIIDLLKHIDETLKEIKDKRIKRASHTI